MSRPGDAIWSDGRAWIRDTTAYGDHKVWWWCPTSGNGVFRRLSEVRQADDFRWLVRGGKRVVHADDCPPQSAHEAYTFQIANLTVTITLTKSQATHLTWLLGRCHLQYT